MEQVEEICEHIILVNKGQKILDGSVPEIKQQFKENLFSIGLDAATLDTGPDGMRPGIGQLGGRSDISSPVFEVVGNKDHGLVVKIREGYRPNDVLEYFIRQDIGITYFSELLPSLNDIFIRLVEGTPLSRQFQPVTD
jgi:ABC-2 type transport system ATP-binding protein